MTELQVVEWLKRVAPSTGRGVVLGIGDDCAIFRPRGSSQDLLFTTDQFIEGVHFRSTDSPESIGHRALGRGLSDIAAMGGDPRFCLLSLTKPRHITDAWLKRFYRGLLKTRGSDGDGSRGWRSLGRQGSGMRHCRLRFGTQGASVTARRLPARRSHFRIGTAGRACFAKLSGSYVRAALETRPQDSCLGLH